MGEIVLTRIDDRLIHGQVMTAWVKEVNANEIVIVDDGVANDMFLSEVMKASAPSGIDIKVETLESGVEQLKEVSESGRRVIILAKNPGAILYLIENGVDLPKIILGGMGLNSDRKTLYKNIAVTDSEKEELKKIREKGTDLSIHVVPSQKAIELDKYL